MSEMNLPQGWALPELGELVEIIMGQAPPGSACNKVGNGTIFVKAGEFDIERPVVREWTTQPLRHATYGDVLVCVVGATAGKINLGIDCAIGRSVAALRPDAALEQRYLYHFLSTKVMALRGDSTGSAQGVIAKDDLAQIVISYPPLNEQHRIVAKIEELFSELDQGIASLKTAREQLKVYRQALLKHAFEGKLTAAWREQHRDQLEPADALLARIQAEREARHRQQLKDWEANGKQGSKPKAPKPLPPLTAEELAELPELPEGWVGARLGLMTCGVEYGTAAKSSESGPCPVLRMGNIQNGQFDWSDLVYTDDEAEIKKYLLHEGDVLFNRTNSPELVGKTAIFRAKRPALFAGYLIRVNQIPSIVDAQYLNYFLNSHIAKQHGSTVKTDGVNQSNINGEKLINYPFPFCSLDEQKMIVEILDARISDADQLDQTLTTSLQQAEALRQSILKRAFSGQLVPQDPSDEPASALLNRIREAQQMPERQRRIRKSHE